MLILSGVQRSHGVYEGNTYDNYLLHCLDSTPFSSESKPLLCGAVTEVVKVRASDVRSVFGGLIGSDSDFESLLGYGVKVSYDRYGRAVEISFIDSPAPPSIPKEGGVKNG